MLLILNFEYSQIILLQENESRRFHWVTSSVCNYK